MCSKSCCEKEDHLLECLIFKESNFKVNASKFKYDPFEPLYDVITPLRMLGLKKQRPNDWKALMTLTSHLEGKQKADLKNVNKQLNSLQNGKPNQIGLKNTNLPLISY